MKGHSPVEPRHRTLMNRARVVTGRRLLAKTVVLALLLTPILASPALADLAANPGGPYTGVVDEKVEFDGSGSTEGDEDIDDYLWSFGDGSTGSGKTPDHTYRSPGTFVVTLTVTDDAGNAASASTTASILPNQAPVPDPGGPYVGAVGEKVKFDGTGSRDVDGKIESYRWDFGDGKTGKGDTPDHAYQTAGLYTVTLTVTDDDDATASLSTTATIVDPDVPMPTVSITQPSPGADLQGTTTLIAATSNDPVVTRIDFFVDGTLIGTDNASPWSTVWDTTTVPNGAHTLTAVATDTVGRSSRDSISINVDNNPALNVRITSPAGGSVVSGNVSVLASAEGAVRVQFFADGASIGIDYFGFNGWSVTWNTTNVQDGSHTLAATATDRRGQTSTDSIIVTVANTPTTTTTTPATTTTTQVTTTTTLATTTSTAPETTTTAATTSESSIPSTFSPPLPTTLVPSIQVLGETIEAATKAIGLSATSFSVAPLALVPGDEITLTLQFEAIVAGYSQVLFLLDGQQLGEPAAVTTGTELTFTRVLPADLAVGQHRIEVVTEGDPPLVLASRSVGVALTGSGSTPSLPQPAAAASTGTGNVLPAVGLLAIVALIAAGWRNRKRWRWPTKRTLT